MMYQANPPLRFTLQTLVLISVGWIATGAVGQEPAVQPARPLEVLKDWRTEKLPLPTGFAPQLKLRGAEDVRFAPGMFDPRSDHFFTYAFSFWLEPEPALDAELLGRQLLVYFRGLARAVGREAISAEQLREFEWQPVKSEHVDKNPIAGHVPDQLSARLRWIEPFATKQPQTLHLRMRFWTCDAAKRNCVVVLVSPQDPQAAEGRVVWEQLEKLATTFQCHLP